MTQILLSTYLAPSQNPASSGRPSSSALFLSVPCPPPPTSSTHAISTSSHGVHTESTLTDPRGRDREEQVAVCGVAPRAIKRHGHRLLVLGRSSNAATPVLQQETVRPLRAWAARGWPASMGGARQAARGWQASTGGARRATSLEISPFLFSRMCRKEKR